MKNLQSAPSAHHSHWHRIAMPTSLGKSSHHKTLVLLVLTVCLWGSFTLLANARYQRTATPQTVASQEVYLTVTRYELALIQVLSEICPSVLNTRQKINFNRAYDRQLRAFMPRATNPHQTLRELSNQREYRNILQNVRAWTASYPADENRALCYEFANMG
ncbi:MCR_0457 family protein [Moraxella cuniculi]|nr:hypothetical protein [Moraxella cuniculi]